MNETGFYDLISITDTIEKELIILRVLRNTNLWKLIHEKKNPRNKIIHENINIKFSAYHLTLIVNLNLTIQHS
jgi:hypothetical protein